MAKKKIKSKPKKLQTIRGVSIHEAAHFVLTNILCPTHQQVKVSIAPEHRTLGRVLGETLFSQENFSIKDIESEVITLYAGYVAEMLFCKTQVRIAKMGAQDDFDVANDVLRNTKFAGLKLRRLKERLLSRTKTIVKKYRSTIEVLASELRRYKTLEGDEAVLIVALSLEDKNVLFSVENLRQIKSNS